MSCGKPSNPMTVPTFESALNSWLARAQKIAANTLEIDPKGIKYVRIVQQTGSQISVYAFIDKSNGDVLMPASWSAPAKHARGNIYQIGNEGAERFGVHYLR